jgi:copper(I)-binding protein
MDAVNNYSFKRRVKMRQIIALVVTAFISLAATAADAGITVSDAWGRATAPGQDSGMVEFSILSKNDAKLVLISSTAANRVEIHSMTHANGKMLMRPVDFIALPAGKVVDLAKIQNHVMLINLKRPLKTGESIPLLLTIEFADKRSVTVEVKAEIKAHGASHGMGGMHDM